MGMILISAGIGQGSVPPGSGESADIDSHEHKLDDECAETAEILETP
jgi:hypothetical protein